MSDLPLILEKGLPTLDNGYQVVPILPEKKTVGINGWQSLEVDKQGLKNYAAGRYAKGGIGILARHTPGIDIDVSDKDIVDEVYQHLITQLGDSTILSRRGNPPRILIPCQTNEPFTKVSSRRWVDADGADHKLEILGDGQQWVAFGVHPDTQRPYQWRGKGATPAHVNREDLPELNAELAMKMVRWFEDKAPEWGWIPKPKDKVKTASTVARGDDEGDGGNDWFANLKTPHGVTADEMTEALSALDPDMMMASWVEVGMACWHESRGDDWGMECWEEWSKGSDKYNPQETRLRWKSFKEGIGNNPITWSSVVHWVKETKHAQGSVELWKLLDRVKSVLTPEELIDEVCPDIQQTAYEGLLDRSAITQLEHQIKKNYARVAEGAKLAVADVRALIRPEMHGQSLIERGELEVSDVYPWSEGWVYLTNGDRYYHEGVGLTLSERGLNARYNRELIGQYAADEDDTGKLRTNASDILQNVVKCPVVRDTMYMPGVGEHFQSEGYDYVNSYHPGGAIREGLKHPDDWDESDRQAINVVEDHFEALVPNLLERSILINFIARRVKLGQEGRKHRWAVLLQGMHGDGKSFINQMLSAVMGVHNVRAINASETEDKFNLWAASSQFVFIEELKMHGHNRYDVVNKLKPLISNDHVSVRAMQKDSIQVHNVTDYIAFSNYTDGIPIEQTDRRWFVLFSAMQCKADLVKHAREALSMSRSGGSQGDDGVLNTYFSRLFAAVENNAAALGGWMRWVVGENADDVDSLMWNAEGVGRYDLAPGVYNPNGRAPETGAKRMVIDAGKHDIEAVVQDLIADDGYPEINEEVINATRLWLLLELGAGAGEELTKKSLATVLDNLGYFFHSRRRIQGGDRARFYITKAHRESGIHVDDNGVGGVGTGNGAGG